ncbi:MAG TPA: hypothetical protein VM848_15825 [Acidimicrobiia bacterium]|nr:hypothetical protein [Acidimicrobiia bacterium]
MGKPVLRPMVLAVGLLLAACVNGTAVTTPGSLDPAPTTTLAGASTTDPLPETTTTEPPEETTTSTPPGASFEDMAGTYGAKDPGGVGFFRIMDDGTLHWAPSEDGPEIVLSARIEGTSVLLTDPDCGEGVVGIYGFDLLETGDLEVVLVEDSCRGRADNLPGIYAPVE